MERSALVRLENQVEPEKVASEVVALLKSCRALQVLVLERSVEEADEMVTEPPREMLLPLMVMLEFWSWLLPRVEVATREPLALTASKVLLRPVMAKEEEVAAVSVVLPVTPRVPPVEMLLAVRVVPLNVRALELEIYVPLK